MELNISIAVDSKRHWVITAMSIVRKGFRAIVIIEVSTASLLIFDLPVHFPHTESPHEKARSGRHDEKYTQN